VKAQILTFSCWGDTTPLEYDSTTADMEEVNRVARGPLPIANGLLVWTLVSITLTQCG